MAIFGFAGVLCGKGVFLLVLDGYLGRRIYVTGSGYEHGLFMVWVLIAVFVVLYILYMAGVGRWCLYFWGTFALFLFLLDCTEG